MDCRKIEKLCVLLGRGNKEKGKYLLEDLYDVLENMDTVAKNSRVEKHFNGLCLNATWKFIQELDELRKKKRIIISDEYSGILLYLGYFMLVLPDVDKKRAQPEKEKAKSEPKKKKPLVTAMRKAKRRERRYAQ